MAKFVNNFKKKKNIFPILEVKIFFPEYTAASCTSYGFRATSPNLEKKTNNTIPTKRSDRSTK